MKYITSSLCLSVLWLSVTPALARRKPSGPPLPNYKITQDIIDKGTKGNWDDEPIEQAIKKGIAFLKSSQKPDGSFGFTWGTHFKEAPTGYKTDPRYSNKLKGTLQLPMKVDSSVGSTALAVYALLKADVDIKDSVVQKALEYITSNDTQNVYEMGIRCNTFVEAEKYERGKYMKNLRHDAIRLIYSINKDTGGWNYDILDGSDYHNSPAQYGILGIWGYQMLSGEIPGQLWPLAWKYWSLGQEPDGGWAYSPPFRKDAAHAKGLSTGSMSAAGLASLFVINDAVNSGNYLLCKGGKYPPEIEKGLAWFDKEFSNTMTGATPPAGSYNFYCYYLYGVERVALASGYKYFGNQDWFKLGALSLLKSQGSNGQWATVPETAYAIVFLCKGRYPLLFNKLEYPGDWNNRPRNLANLTQWMSRNYEREFNWQIVNLKVDPFEWHDSPLLCITGSKKPSFSNEEIEKIKLFIQQGGTVFSCTECNGGGFKTGIRAIYRKAFPKYEMVRLAPDHPLYTLHAKLKGKPAAYMISNGSRPLVIHTDVDIARDWQARTSATKKGSFEFGVNLTRYIVGSYLDLVPRGRTYWPFPAEASTKVKVARIEYGGNFNPEPLALESFSRKLAADASTSLEEVIVKPAELAGCGAKIAFLTGTDSVSLSPEQTKALKAFADGGGTLVIDGTGGKAKFYESMHKNLRDAFGQSALQPVPKDSPILSGIEKVRYRISSRKRISTREALLQIITVNGREAVILSREDLTTGLLGCPSGVVDGYEPDSAYQIVKNIVSQNK